MRNRSRVSSVVGRDRSHEAPNLRTAVIELRYPLERFSGFLNPESNPETNCRTHFLAFVAYCHRVPACFILSMYLRNVEKLDPKKEFRR